MNTSTKLFLAYVAYKRTPQRHISFAEYVTERPDLSALILVSMLADEAGIPRINHRGRKRKSRVTFI